MNGASTADGTIALAEAVLRELHHRSLDAVVIGAAALAVHGYTRATEDLDLAVVTEPATLHLVGNSLRALGFEVDVQDPDGDDPLGGVLNVRAPGADLVQVVNFLNPPANGFPRVVLDSLAEATALVPGGSLKVVDLYHLVAFKLYAGGAKSKLDILELLARNPNVDRQRLRVLCEGYALGAELHRVLELESQRP